MLLRPLRDEDLPDFAALGADPRVMRHFPALLSWDQSAAALARLRAHGDSHGFAPMAVERLGDGAPSAGVFVGVIGLAVPRFSAPFTPCVEIVWRLAASSWGHGYATEGARAVVAFAFERLKLPEIVSFTTAANLPSRRVMERLGMTRNPAEDFLHPGLEATHPLAPHVLYRLPRIR